VVEQPVVADAAHGYPLPESPQPPQQPADQDRRHAETPPGRRTPTGRPARTVFRHAPHVDSAFKTAASSLDIRIDCASEPVLGDDVGFDPSPGD
jgi:hypothetical protein